MLEVGQAFPSFSLQDQDGNPISQDAFAGARAVIYFYPKDDTPGCTTEACNFRDSLETLQGVKVFGVSPDSVKSHAKFVQKFNLNFTLIADTEHTLAESCGAWVEKSMYGKKYMGVQRCTFLIDEKGTVVKVWESVKPAGHADEVREAIKHLG